jgi:predicted RecB family nuclease
VARGPLLTAADVARCPHRVALDRGSPISPPEEQHSTEIVRRIRDAGQHRSDITERLIELHPHCVEALNAPSTMQAMANGAALILQARFVEPGPATRTASADLLLRTGGADDSPTYSPIIVKFNEIIELASTRRLLESSLETLSPDMANWIGGVGVRRNDTMVRNGLALCHATRVLESLGYADPEHRGGVIDRHGRLWWFELDHEDCGRWSLSKYDEAYEQRAAILRAHELWRTGDAPFPTVPFWHRECPNCPYHAHCESELEAHDDVSLVRFTSLEQQALLHDHAVRTRVELSRLDPDKARLARVKTVVDTSNQDIEAHLGKAIDKLEDLIYRARALVRATPLRIVDAESMSCATADVEVDVDMESYNDTTYLWGALVSTRRHVEGVTAGYVSFECFEHLNADAEARIFRDFWQWFIQLRDHVHARGASFAAYCFWAQAEDGAMNRAVSFDSSLTPNRAELDEFRHSQPPEWIDLHEVAKRQIQTDGPLGLKSLARNAGFQWRDENPSGEASMTWYEEATGSTDIASSARQRILEYNEDDCRATYALREWLNDGARKLPHRDERP